MRFSAGRCVLSGGRGCHVGVPGQKGKGVGILHVRNDHNLLALLSLILLLLQLLNLMLLLSFLLSL